MNARLRAAQDTLARLTKEARDIQSAETLTEEQEARADALPGEIDAAKEAIEREKKLADAAGSADEYLNGSGDLKSVVSGVQDPEARKDDLEKIAKNYRGRANFTALAFGGDLDKAAQSAHRFGRWLHASLGNRASLAWCKRNGLDLQASHAEGVNETGGALVPAEFERSLIVLREEYGVFRQNARVIPMASDTLSVPRRTSGITAYAVGEGATITESTMGFDRVNLVAKKWAALTVHSSELGEDAYTDFGDIIVNEIAWAFAKKEDECGFVGDGTSTYNKMTGIATRLKDVHGVTDTGYGLKLGTGNAYSELTMDDFHGTTALLPIYAMRNAKWYVSKPFWENVMVNLALDKGGVPAAEVVTGIALRFLGYPVVLTQAMPMVAANSQVCAVLADLSLSSVFGDRRSTTIAVSAHDQFPTDELSIRGTTRYDVNNHGVGTAATESGPAVGLITAAS